MVVSLLLLAWPVCSAIQDACMAHAVMRTLPFSRVTCYWRMCYVWIMPDSSPKAMRPPLARFTPFPIFQGQQDL
jgi:hypothetical protein